MRYQRAHSAAWRRVLDQTIVLNVAGRHLYGLNDTAACLWDALESPQDAASLADLVGAGETELSSFLEELQREGLIEPCQPGGPGPVAAAAPSAVHSAPPRIEWKEEMYRFGGACAKVGLQPPVCDQEANMS